jgi:hypothetical protein
MPPCPSDTIRDRSSAEISLLWLQELTKQVQRHSHRKNPWELRILNWLSSGCMRWVIQIIPVNHGSFQQKIIINLSIYKDFCLNISNLCGKIDMSIDELFNEK